MMINALVQIVAGLSSIICPMFLAASICAIFNINVTDTSKIDKGILGITYIITFTVFMIVSPNNMNLFDMILIMITIIMCGCGLEAEKFWDRRELVPKIIRKKV